MASASQKISPSPTPSISNTEVKDDHDSDLDIMLYGTVLIILGSTIVMKFDSYVGVGNFSVTPFGLVITLGLILLVYGALALKMLYSGRIMMLNVYFYISAMLIVLMLVSGVLVFVYAEQVSLEIASDLNLRFSTYKQGDSQGLIATVDKVQSEYHCCGYKDFLEWRVNPLFNCNSSWAVCQLPESCCPKQIHRCVYSPNSTTNEEGLYTGYPYGTGCKLAFARWLETKIDSGGIASLLAFSMQVVCWMALNWHIKNLNDKRRASIL
ncbi:CD151 antigen-like [Watersipora subatra]|uniref:CD151 antigen-like n=1 Tax=Watersipora subatra TaxID=2589382 RepID=UPI00355BCAE5